jgi:peptide chain release factor 2
VTLFDVPSKLKRQKELEDQMGQPGFFDNQTVAQKIIAEIKLIKTTINPVQDVLAGLDDVKAMIELGEEAGDQATLDEADQSLATLEAKGQKVELQSLLDGKADAYNCFVTIQAGAGGTEAQDWAEMLSRMYIYFWEKRGWDISEFDKQYGEQAGIKTATYLVKGEYAFGYMRAEHGTHRLVRPSPYNAQGKRQTSFAGVSVEPEIPEGEVSKEIPEVDLEIEAFVRASGPGGQNVNKVASACRVRHKPTGLTVTCSVERSLQQNKRIALNMIASKLELLEQAQRDAELKELVGEKSSADFGTQIRNYVLDDRRVKDVRTLVETSDVESVLDRGEIDQFIDAELRRKRATRKS